MAGAGQQSPAVTDGIQHEVARAPAAAAAVQQARRAVAARTGSLEDGFLDGPAAQAVTLPGRRGKAGGELPGSEGRRGR